MKYYPKGDNITDSNNNFINVNGRNTSQFLCVFVWYNNLNSSKSLSGNIYAYSPVTPYQITLNIQQIIYPLTTISYALYKNNQQDANSVNKISSTTLSFNMMTSSTDTPNSYNV